ncbi:unnamed protein product [Cuscuta epithymum]|uniref:Uncharacterized protein n=1 Tax=Cuscuta epithymum TaxID=186058 RepID=A0AAV0DKG0_9ASTE|nr:unnamed protein product [Cuscuta epithymum]
MEGADEYIAEMDSGNSGSLQSSGDDEQNIHLTATPDPRRVAVQLLFGSLRRPVQQPPRHAEETLPESTHHRLNHGHLQFPSHGSAVLYVYPTSKNDLNAFPIEF